MSWLGIVRLALEGLFRKKGRNMLTMSGVVIGVLSLTLIVALGQGLGHVISGALGGSDNLRQVSLSGGFGVDLTYDPYDVEIEGEMPEARRERLKRAAINRRQIRQGSGRRTNFITDEVIEKLSEMDHVEKITPVIVERYRIQVDEFNTDGTLSFGVDVERDRYRERVMTGDYFSSADADEVLIHEYLLYQWGLITTEEQNRIVGQILTLESIPTADNDQIQNLAPQIAQFNQSLNEEEKEALKILGPKLLKQLGMNAERREIKRELKVIGVLRETEPGDVFNVIEDGNSVQADLFLPQGTARELFLESSVNRELGYPRAVVLVDDPDNAPDVEQTLRDRGFTAFSIASVLKQVESMLTAITVIISFITGVALIVATLGIVNTMITSVLERTREIGVFKAVGATNAQVMGVFLIESALIGLVGGLIGLGIAAVAMIPGDIIAGQMIAEKAAIPFDGDVFVLPVWLAVAGPLLGTVVAVLAAILPARRASAIDPVKALRRE